MSNDNIIRAWKDPEYRSNLNAHDRALLPANPAGIAEIDDGKLAEVAGGAEPWYTPVFLCTHEFVCTDEFYCPKYQW
jgi:mersacidin/lichenicidin family type 2 lantibiotic